MRPSQRLLLFSSQEYSIISQSGLSVKVRVLFHGLRERFGVVDDHLRTRCDRGPAARSAG